MARILKLRIGRSAAARCLLTLFILALTLSPRPAALARDPSEDADAERAAWRYHLKDKDVTVTLTHAEDKEWIAQRTDDRKETYDETSRTADYVELQNRTSKLFVRLHSDYAEWRRPKDEKWTRWVHGSWVDPSPAPADPPTARLPATEPRRVRVAYFVPSDRKPVANWEKKIRLIMTIVSELYERDLKGKGYESDGITFERDEKEEMAVRLVRGDKKAADYNNAPKYDADEQWRRLLPEIQSKVGDTRKQVIVVFAATVDEAPSQYGWPGTIARGAYYSADGGLAICSANLLRDEFCATTLEAQRKLFFDETPVPGRRAMGHRPNSPRCEFVEDGFGAVAHELGHALGLPHDRRKDDRDIMGNGFRNLRWNFGSNPAKKAEFSDDNARILMSSRYVAKDMDLTDNDPPQAEFDRPVSESGALIVSIKATDKQGLRAVVFIDRDAGTVIAGRKLTGKTQEFSQRLATQSGKSAPARIQALLTDDGGNLTRASFTVP